MDIASLLYGYRPLSEPNVASKTLSLRSAYSVLTDAGHDISTGQFVDVVSDIAEMQFGGGAADSYFTAFLSVAKFYDRGIDTFAGAVINSVLLDLNFQTRLSIDGVIGSTEAALYEGDEGLFPVAMTHANVVVGFHVDGANENWPPEWATIHPSIEINRDNAVKASIEDLPTELARRGKDRIGAIIVAFPQRVGGINLAERYQPVAHMVSRHTMYAFAGSAEMILSIAAQFEGLGHAKFDLRLYNHDVGNAVEHRGVLVATGLSSIPAILVVPGVTRGCSFIEAAPKGAQIHPGVEIFSYLDPEAPLSWTEYRDVPEYDRLEIGRWERAPRRTPFIVKSSAPIPEEGRERISDNTEIFHTAAVLENGILIGSQDHAHSTYLHATGNGEILLDYGDEGRNSTSSPIFQNGVVDEDGVRKGVLSANRVIRVRGAAMPLMFTPMLHKWHSHFMIQCLPRVNIARAYAEDVKILVPHDLRAKQLEMLQVLGFGPDRLVTMPPNCLVQADKLIVPRAWRLAFTASTLRIYEEIADKLDFKSIESPKRILISRESRKSWRNMLNYESLQSLLVKDYGFEVVAPERLSLTEEVATYANAEIVIGAEGAGMYGAVFSKPGSAYLTICDEDYVMVILATIAERRGIDLGYVFGESFRSDDDVLRRLPFGHADFVIDLAKVEDAVIAAIARTSER